MKSSFLIYHLPFSIYHFLTFMYRKIFTKVTLIALALFAFGCQKNVFQSPTVAPASLRDVAAVKLNFRFETDVPAPPANAAQTAQSEERNAAIQNDFDQNRAEQILDKTISSPDKQRVIAVYHRSEDLPAEFRLDAYSPDGKLLKKITHNGMAVHFPETILWSPNSTDLAFVAMARTGGNNQTSSAPAADVPSISPNPNESAVNNSANTEANNAANTNASAENTNSEIGNAAPTQTPAAATAAEDAPSDVLTFRTEQLYVCNRDGGDLKPLTQNEGLIYFYFVWSPDGASLAALAETFQEWRFMQAQADSKNEVFIPAGRLRLVEKTGRERRLDDNLTTVRPAWSPDAAKVATAFGTQVRIYDTIGDAPTQAAVPLRNQLLISSKTYDENEQRKLEQTTAEANTNANANAKSNTKSNAGTAANSNANQTSNANAAANQPVGSLPDESTLVSFNPIVNLEWTEDKMLYLQTGYIKQMKNETDSAHSFLRWHRLVFSPQAIALGGGK